MTNFKQYLFFGVLILSSVSFGFIDANSQKPTNHLAIQRSQFLDGESALNHRDLKKFYSLQRQLVDYPLYPYLVYQDIVRKLPQLPRGDVFAFIGTYRDTPLATQLYEKWLLELAKQRRWKEFAGTYRPSASVRLQCLQLQAKLAIGETAFVFSALPSYWLTGSTQPHECDPAFNAWINAKRLTTNLMWQRLSLAFRENNMPLVHYVTSLLPPEQKHQAILLTKIYHAPTLLEAKTLEGHPHSALFGQNLNEHIDIAVYGLKRLARTKPHVASNVWQHVQSQFPFNEQQRDEVMQALVNGFGSAEPEQARAWLTQINPSHLDQSLQEWQVRYALRQGDWTGVNLAISKLSPEQRHEPVWRYWHGRSIQEQGHKVAAAEIFQQLAASRNYYGFLASQQLNHVYAIHNTSHAIAPSELHGIATLPAVKRAVELSALHRYPEANREWWSVVNNMDNKHRYIAARYAQQSGLHALALATSSKANEQNDLGLLYPTPYDGSVSAEAGRHQVKASLLFALIRQESLFQPNATSVVGARGLMQLMPATAKLVARRMNHPAPHTQNLYQPHTNIRLGSAYFTDLLNLYSHNPILAIASYNAGPNRVKKWLPEAAPVAADIWIETIPWRETRNYVKLVITNALIYDYLLGLTPNMQTYLPEIPVRKV